MATTFVASGGRAGQHPPSGRRRIIKGVLTTDGGDGAGATDIAASVFGLTIIEECSPLVKSDNTLLVTAAPTYAGTYLLGKAAATAAPADIPSGDYAVTIRGYY